MRHKAKAAAVRRAGSMQAIDSMNHFYLNHEMFVCGSACWNIRTRKGWPACAARVITWHLC